MTKTPLTPAEVKTYQEALTNITDGKFDKAISDLSQLAQMHPAHIGANINLATAYFKNKNMAEASRSLENIKKINPKVQEMYNLSGLIDVEKGEYNSAEKKYLAAIAINKDYSAAHYNLALVYDLFYQDLGQAIIQYEQYLALTGNTDKDTINWVTELKLKQKRGGAQ